MKRRTLLSTLLAGLPAGWAGGAYASDAPGNYSIPLEVVLSAP